MTSINTILPIDEIEVNGTTIPLKPVVDTKFARSLIEGSFTGTEIPKEYLEGLTKIRDGIFAYSNIVSFEMPDTVTEIGISNKEGIGVFCDCTNLINVKLSANISTIPSSTFKNCTSLKVLQIPYGIKQIGTTQGGTYSKYSIAHSSMIEELYIPDSVNKLGRYCFSGMTNLRTISLPNTLTDAYTLYGAFYGCTSLENINIPNKLTHIFHDAFVNCSSLKHIEIPDSVTSIASSAFSGCSSLIEIDLNNVKSLANGVFKNCSSLSSVVMNEGFKTISNSTFENCVSLPTITIPSSITKIDYLTFSGCDSLTEMIVLNTTPPTLQNINAISSATTKIYVPYGCKTAYEIATNWSSLLTRETNPVTFIELNEDGSKPLTGTDVEVPNTSILL